MPLETVRVRVLTDDPVPEAVEDVIIRIFDENTEYVTQAVTGSDGWADVTLNGDDPGIEYQLRFYLVGGSFEQPQMIEVFSPASASPTGTNDFGVSAHLRTLPEAVDPRLCRASVRVLWPDGRPKVGADAHFIPLFSPVMTYGEVVLAERVTTRSDRNGLLLVDLFRDCCYEATVEGHENIQRQIHVPDRPSVNLGDLLFPIVTEVEFTPAPAPDYTVPVGGSLLLVPTVRTSDHRELVGVAPEDVEYVIDDITVAAVQVFSQTQIVLRGVAAGTTTLRMVRRDTSIRRMPDAQVGTPVTVNVS